MTIPPYRVTIYDLSLPSDSLLGDDNPSLLSDDDPSLPSEMIPPFLVTMIPPCLVTTIHPYRKTFSPCQGHHCQVCVHVYESVTGIHVLVSNSINDKQLSYMLIRFGAVSPTSDSPTSHYAY